MPSAGTPAQKSRKIGPVLVVEDDAALALAVEDALLDAGARSVSIASTTQQAIDTLRDDRFETVILDVHLADRGDGWAIAELVRALGAGGPKIIFATGSPDAIPADIADLGPVLAKPYDFNELVAHVRARGRMSLFSRLRRD
ncbi:response regulator transcription factor [Alteriqipengyuania lutimaris]|uniref:Response regulator n=1 Tax=Alteriqipengyuania lutimaris TaxID=1538146 RepID=A0A395LHI0_9SPHN|nr:response regulator [Alteriqipengyuania lutimaris]MBB3034839.1 DNA-binding response OmpR family regulator [Alteriqipengyuania lutimaris]RDS76323.1 response regulator [Alteriqipengyuania lutimaris]